MNKNEKGNEKSMKPKNKTKNPSDGINQKNLSEDSTGQASGCLIGYKKKDLSEVNYFLPKKNCKKQEDLKLTKNLTLKLPIETPSPSVEPPKNFWNVESINDLENNFKQIMIKEKQQKMQRIKNSSCSPKYFLDIRPDEQRTFSSSKCQVPRRTLSLEENACQSVVNENRERKSKNNWFENKSNSSDIRDRKYSLDQFVTVKKRTKAKSKILPTKSSENINKWSILKSHQDDVCLDQIITEEKIKERNTKIKQHSESYQDNIFLSLNDCRSYSLNDLLQNDENSSVINEWLQDNDIYLDQIMIERKIKRKVQRTKYYSETSSEEDFYKPESSFSPIKITKMSTFLNSLMRCFRLCDVSLGNKPYVLKKMEKTSQEYHDVSSQFLNTVRDHKIDCIKKVVNPYLLLQYNLKKATLRSSERILFHGTKIENLDSICTENFDWRWVERHKYGWGVSFSNSAYYASHYSDQNASTMVMFVVKVLVDYEWYGDCYTEVPKEPYDTTINLDGKVYVKFDDCCFYPSYVIFYKKD